MKAQLIVPCYNEEATLQKSFILINKLLSESSKDLHGVLFVNDGSSDHTQQVLEQKRKELIPTLKVQNSILHLEKNRGKAWAVFAGMQKLKDEKKINDDDLLFLLDWDIVEKIPDHIVKDIKEMFLENDELDMVIIWAEEWYATNEIMIEASGQRVLKFWAAYKALRQALEKDTAIGYGIEWLFNTVFEGHTEIYRDAVISTKPPYRPNNIQNSASRQWDDLRKAQSIAKAIL